MAAKQVINQANIMTETVASGLNINRFVDPISLSAGYHINLSYIDNEFMVDVDGVKTRLLSSGNSPKYVSYTPAQALTFFSAPMKKADGTDTVLGEFLAEMMDAAIVEDLNKVV